MTRSEASAIAAAPGGKVTAVLGPTNTGKTHLALDRMMGHESGMIGLPLRLLAREIYDRIVSLKGVGAAALITGEEKIIPADARFFVCTVEAMPLDREVSFLAVDEIQLCADPERGHVFTDRLLHARGSSETMFLGAETMRNVIRTLLPQAKFITRTRFSELTHAGSRKLSRLPRRSAIVAFSAEAVYGLAEVMRRQRGGAAVVMGALSPRTRNAQVDLYQSGDVDFLVATDAIGMGLNMDVDHVALASLRKFDGSTVRPLRAHEIGQIAGRAGRYLNDGTFGTTGDAADLDPDLVEQIESHRFDPVRVVQWRNRDLDFGSLEALIESLEMPPPVKGLARARVSSDYLALGRMAEDMVIRESLEGRADLERLWSVCQIPDFRNMSLEEHVVLLTTIYKNLLDHDNRLPADWLAGHLDRLDRTEGDIDTLSMRIAHVRTWTFVTNRAQWLDDADHWQERARAIEDKLSDALHEGLTQRFIDKRTSHLMRSLQLKDDLVSEISAEGEVTVEGHYVGKLQGFQFVPDPRAGGLDGKALRSAAAKALRTMIGARAAQLVGAPDTAIELSDHGRLWWQGDPVARLAPGADGLSPKVVIMGDGDLETAEREALEARLTKWVTAHIARILAPLLDLREAVNADTGGDDAPVSADQIVGGVAPLTGLARGIGFQLVENSGVLDRRDVSDQVRQLDQDGRAHLRRFGVRFGQFSIFIPALLKPVPARLLVTLWGVHNNRFSEAQDPDRPPPAVPSPGLCSVPIDASADKGFYAAVGFRMCGLRAVRIDMLERLGDMIRNAKTGTRPAQPQKVQAPKSAEASAASSTAAEPPVAEPGSEEAVQTPAVENDASPAQEGAANETLEVTAQTTGMAETEGDAVTAVSSEVDPSAEVPQAQTVTEDAPADKVDAVEAKTEAEEPETLEPQTPEPEVPVTEAPVTGAEEAVQPAPDDTPPVTSGEPEAASETPASDQPEQAAQEVVTAAEGETQEESKPDEKSAPDGPALPEGTFKATSEMMSIVGCSGEEFEGILKALGYRRQTLKMEGDEAEELVVWRPASRKDRARGPRREGGPRQQARPQDRSRPGHHKTGAGRPDTQNRDNGKGRGGRGPGKAVAERSGKPPRRSEGGRTDKGGHDRRGNRGVASHGHKSRKEPAFDPDSPFAVLAALKKGDTP